MQDHDNKNHVTVRVWTSLFNPIHKGENVGHVSIQTPIYYISLWPRQTLSPQMQAAKDLEGKGIFQGITHEFVPSLEIDCKYEGNRAPEYKESFSGLDIDAINKRFEELKKTMTGWRLFPGICDNTQSCASLAWELLTAGNIKKLIYSSTHAKVSSIGMMQGFFSAFLQTKPERSITGSMYSIEMAASIIVTSPDSLVELLKKAKEKEIILTQQTRQLSPV